MPKESGFQLSVWSTFSGHPEGSVGSPAGELLTLPGEDPTSMVNQRRERNDGLRAPAEQIARVKWVYPALRQDER